MNVKAAYDFEDRLLDDFKNGTITAAQFVQELREKLFYTQDEAKQYLDETVDFLELMSNGDKP